MIDCGRAGNERATDTRWGCLVEPNPARCGPGSNTTSTAYRRGWCDPSGRPTEFALRVIGTARHRRDHRHLVAVAEASRWVGILPVAGEPHRCPARPENRISLDKRGPGRLDIGPVGQVDANLAGTGELTLDREQADPDGDGHEPGQPRRAAMSRPSPTGRIVASNRGSASSAVSKARNASVRSSPVV